MSPIDGTRTNLVEVMSIGSLLVNYQRTVVKLLSLRSCTGVSFQELERFKREFRTSAFTCRLWSCPYAGSGFDNNKDRLVHEVSHWGIVCPVPGCLYPPFTSKKSLDGHRAECHGNSSGIMRKSIRRSPGSSKPGASYTLGDQEPDSSLLSDQPMNSSKPSLFSTEPSSIDRDMQARTFAVLEGESARQSQSQSQSQSQTHPQLIITQGRLMNILLEEVKTFGKQLQTIPDIPMTLEEHEELANRLKETVIDMNNIGRQLSIWHGITKDDERARLFFRVVSLFIFVYMASPLLILLLATTLH